MNADPGRWGVVTGFHDVAGTWRDAPGQTVERILTAMGADGEPPPPAAVTVRTDHPLPPIGAGRVVLEDGGEVQWGHDPIPPGYHRFEPAEGQPHPLIVSPGVVPYPSRREWGFAVQLYAMRSKKSWGIGDLGDLRELCRWSADLGAGFTLVNPLHAVAPGLPQQRSPYYPGSRCFVNPLYIAVEDLPGAAGLEDLDRLVAAGRALNADRLLDRDAVWTLKSQALEEIFANSDGAAGFDEFISSRGEALEMFSVYCAAAELFGQQWQLWPEPLRHPDSPAVAELARERRIRVWFYSWLQWIADEQLASAGSQLDLVSDLAVGVDPAGPDAWIWQDSIADSMRVGAPPDEFNTQGQCWDLPPHDPWKLRASAYAPFLEAVRSGLRHASGLRIDHVMGLFRLYWIPVDEDPRRGAYVRYPHHDMLNILALEAHRAGAYVVGEDLGTVEDEVRRDLAERRMLSYRVWWFESESPRSWPEAAMGAVTTHDLPTVAGLFSGSDLDAQRRLGTAPNEEAVAGVRRKLMERTESNEDTPVEEVIARVYDDLAAAPCALLTASLDDAAAVEERPNMPGTIDVWPNWSIALPCSVEELEERPLPERIARALNRP